MVLRIPDQAIGDLSVAVAKTFQMNLATNVARDVVAGKNGGLIDSITTLTF